MSRDENGRVNQFKSLRVKREFDKWRLNNSPHKDHITGSVNRQNASGRGRQCWKICWDCRELIRGPLKRSRVPNWQSLPLLKYADVAGVLAPGKQVRSDLSAVYRERWWKLYNRYLKSKEWKSKRQEVMDRDGGRCVACGGVAQQVHHLDYERVGDEDLTDLVSVCDGCHKASHQR